MITGLLIEADGKTRELKAAQENKETAIPLTVMRELAESGGFYSSKDMFPVIIAGNRYETIEQSCDTERKLQLTFILYIKTRPSDVANLTVNDFFLKMLKFSAPDFPVYGAMIVTVYDTKLDRPVWMKPQEVQLLQDAIGASTSLPVWPWEAPPGGPTQSGCVYITRK